MSIGYPPAVHLFQVIDFKQFGGHAATVAGTGDDV
jgi:hypothetical protein